MIAVKRLQSLIWVILVALGALGAYMVSLKVATERNELMKVRAQIARAKADIRYLETEFSARASMRQLESWNQHDFLYAAPTAQQYLGGEQALAHLDGVQPNGPDYVAPPVMVAMVTAAPETVVAKPKAPESPAATQIRSDIAVIREAHAADNVDKLPKPVRPTPAQRAKVDADVSKPNPIARKAERMAMLDAKLLDDSTLGDLSAKAAREKRKETR
jgi:hypothetical protein